MRNHVPPTTLASVLRFHQTTHRTQNRGENRSSWLNEDQPVKNKIPKCQDLSQVELVGLRRLMDLRHGPHPRLHTTIRHSVSGLSCQRFLLGLYFIMGVRRFLYRDDSALCPTHLRS